MFGLLAELFERVSGVIADVVEPDDAGQVNLITLYERWRKHRDPRDAKRLVRSGVLLDPDGSDTMQ